MKSGIVTIVGRPNAGKSTLVNAILGHKVSITSPKPQTTRFPIQAVYEDDRGQIIFVDTPGFFGKAPDELARKINARAAEALENQIHVIIYLIDHSRERDFEENKVYGIVRKLTVPKILVFNKIDIRKPTFRVQYKFMEEEFDRVIEISALQQKHINTLLSALFDLLPEGEPLVDPKDMVQPGINLDSKTFVAELIREKAFLNLRREVPYSMTAVVDEIAERANGTLYVRGRIITSDDHYKGMIVGRNGSMIKEIGMAVRKELQVAANKPVFVDLTVEVDPHWVEFA